MAEAFDSHFANSGHVRLVRDIPRADTQPGHYFTVPTDMNFSLNSCSAKEVQK